MWAKNIEFKSMQELAIYKKCPHCRQDMFKKLVNILFGTQSAIVTAL
jgi:hypothetical protein